MATRKKISKPKPRKKATRAKPPAKRAQAGGSGIEERAALFAYAYVANGHNKTAAAVAAGYKPGYSAEKAGQRLSKNVRVKAIIAAATRKAIEVAGATLERTILEIARVAYSDPRNLFDARGMLKPMADLDDDTAATLASIKIGEKSRGAGRGKKRPSTSTVKTVKLWPKDSALEKLMKYHGAYRIDNEQARTVIVNSVDYASMYKGKPKPVP
jgi:phage terminase small subunit